MKRRWFFPHATAVGCAFAAAIVAGVLFTSVPARADISVRIDIGNAPPAPHFGFSARPHERYLPGQRIYVVDDRRLGDNDCFRYGGYYWVFREGYWYRASSWRGRFVVIQPRYVPSVFYRVPPAHWKHRPSGPPSYANRGGNKGGGRPAAGPAKKAAKDQGKQGGGPRK